MTSTSASMSDQIAELKVASPNRLLAGFQASQRLLIRA
jgi:hypothetical protein